jgi:hypothetical protein
MTLPIVAHRSTDRDPPTLQESVELRELPSIAGCAIEMAAPTARLRATDASAPINAICEHEKEDDSDTSSHADIDSPSEVRLVVDSEQPRSASLATDNVLSSMFLPDIESSPDMSVSYRTDTAPRKLVLEPVTDSESSTIIKPDTEEASPR